MLRPTLSCSSNTAVVLCELTLGAAQLGAVGVLLTLLLLLVILLHLGAVILHSSALPSFLSNPCPAPRAACRQSRVRAVLRAGASLLGHLLGCASMAGLRMKGIFVYMPTLLCSVGGSALVGL